MGHMKKVIKVLLILNSREFKKVAKYERFGEHKFHNLRDTYAVRRWIETGDINLASKEIGHSNALVTQKYADFNLKRLKVDFPNMKEIINNRLTKGASNNSLLELGSTALHFGSNNA